LYVAFTRAKENLFVFAPEGKEQKENKFTDVSSLIKRILKNPDIVANGKWDDSESVWSLGELTDRPDDREQGEQILLNSISSHEFSGKLRLMYRGLDFFDTGAQQRVNYGNLMHEIFSRIRSAEDIDRALNSALRDGIIDHTEAARIRPDIASKIDMEKVRGWFDGSWKVIAEQDILTRDGSIRRPDRVMIRDDQVIVVDYKFGMNRSPGHLTQVRKYAGMLRQMEYNDVHGFVWYVSQNEVVGV
jgi:ATP-dependent exoDNAse (exonuclease V) beta subunit